MFCIWTLALLSPVLYLFDRITKVTIPLTSDRTRQIIRSCLCLFCSNEDTTQVEECVPMVKMVSRFLLLCLIGKSLAIIDKSQENSASKFYRASRPILYPADVFTATFTAASTTSTLSTTSASSTNGNAISPPIDSISSSFSLDKLQDLRPWNDSLHGNHSLGLYIPGILIRTGT